jgi:hypothetical protein
MMNLLIFFPGQVIHANLRGAEIEWCARRGSASSMWQACGDTRSHLENKPASLEPR